MPNYIFNEGVLKQVSKLCWTITTLERGTWGKAHYVGRKELWLKEKRLGWMQEWGLLGQLSDKVVPSAGECVTHSADQSQSSISEPQQISFSWAM